MPRTKIELPETFSFSTVIPIRITDLNYGGHVGNDTILSLIHEARVQFLKSFGYDEFNLEGVGLIMSDVAIDFRRELFYGSSITVSVAALNFSKVTFEIFYKIEINTQGNTAVIATAKTGMACFNYEVKRIAPIPEAARLKLAATEPKAI